MRHLRLILSALALMSSSAQAAILKVGSECTHATVASALAAAQPGDLIYIRHSVAVAENIIISKSNLTLRGGFDACSSLTTNLSVRTRLQSAQADKPVVRIAAGVTGTLLDHLEIEGALNPAGAGGNGEGGGVSVGTGAELRMGWVSVGNNRAGRGAGVFLEPNAIFSIEPSSFPYLGGPDFSLIGNIAETNGGGLYASTGAVVDLLSNPPDDHNYVVNAAQRGGAFYLASGSSLYLSGGDVRFNDATQSGGGIYLENTAGGTTISLEDVEFRRNTAVLEGGALFAIGAASTYLPISRCRFDTNEATSTAPGAGNGGALALRGVQAEITDGTFIDNSAQTGGAVFIDQGRFTVIYGGSFTTNSATGRGGAIYSLMDTSPLTIRDGIAGGGVTTAPVFDGNIAGGTGGAIHHSGMANRALNFNVAGTASTSFINNQGSNGGAIHIANADLNLPQRLTMRDNMASGSGGAVHQFGSGTVQMAASVADWLSSFEGNEAVVYGGAFFISSGSLKLDWARIGGDSNNPNLADRGGGIYFEGAGTLQLRNSRVLSNSAQTAGAGVYAAAGSQVVIEGVPGTGTLAGTPALPRCDVGLLISNRYCSEIAFNQVPGGSGQGGGLVAESSASFLLSHTALLSNSAATGSAAQLKMATEMTWDTVLLSGHANAVQVGAGADLSVQASTLTANGAATILLDAASGTRLSMMDSILWGNTEGVVGGAAATITGSCNITQSASIPGFAVDPQFIATTRGDYRLGPSSFALELCSSGAGTDLDGMARPSGGNSDAGAFERLFVAPFLFGNGFE